VNVFNIKTNKVNAVALILFKYCFRIKSLSLPVII